MQNGSFGSNSGSSNSQAERQPYAGGNGSSCRQHYYARLQSDLQSALASLYSLDITTTPTTTILTFKNNHQPPSQRQAANDFLMQLQSRNVRRQIQSMQQQHRDQQQQQQYNRTPENAFVNNNSRSSRTDNNHAQHVMGVPVETTTTAVVHMGSSWLACLTLLCQVAGGGEVPSRSSNSSTHNTAADSNHYKNSHNNAACSKVSFVASTTERLFCAQTLLHRCRRVKLVEAVDWELELWPDTSDKNTLLQYYNSGLASSPLMMTTTTLLQLPPDITQGLTTAYLQLMQAINPLVAHVLLLPDDHIFVGKHSSTADEERVKAELTLLTLATISYQIAYDCCCGNHGGEGKTNTATALARASTFFSPLLSTTTSALVTVTFRMWCHTNTNNAANNNTMPAPNDQVPQQPMSLVNTVRHAFQLVWTATTATPTNDSTAAATEAWSMALLCSLAVLPDVVLGSSGGVRGRLSVDPRAVQWASHHLRHVDTDDLFQVLQQLVLVPPRSSSHNHHRSPPSLTDRCILQTCARWACFLPLNRPLLEISMPLVNQYLVNYEDEHENAVPERSTALAFLIAVYESASWTVDQILSSVMGLTDQQQQQQQTNHKKRQSSRSKKRQKEILESNRTDSSTLEAEAEWQLRGDIACQATMLCWATLTAVFARAMRVATHEINNQAVVEGEGPIGCIAAGANVCLPHILRHSSSLPHGRELFLCMTEAFQQICASPNKTVRALALEPLYTLHKALLEVVRTVGPLNQDFETLVVDHFFKSSMNLASVCEYPGNYFEHLCAESDHDLEIERNDVRDLLRTIGGSGEGGSTVKTGSSSYPLEITIRILAKLVDACNEAALTGCQRQALCSEAALHAFSSLAKPVNHIAKCYAGTGGTEIARHILSAALHFLVEVNQMVVGAFQSLTERQVLPLSRIVNIANASYAPFLSALASVQDADMTQGLARILDVAIYGAILSLEQIPELPAPSILDHSIYDIRGTMRGPGGEDHVGCLTLMRFAFENDALAREMVTASGRYVSRLCDLHQQLKQIEVERGQLVFHGRGVCPQTRRILVGTLCHLELVSQGLLGASSMLSDLFNSAIGAIASFKANSMLGEQELFRMTESTLDLTSFTPTIVISLFESNANEPRRTACLEVLTAACVNGYWRLSGSLFQWNRLRAALFSLLKKSAGSGGDISARGTAVVVACATSECEAIQNQCITGPESKSLIFEAGVVSPEAVPSGLFVRALADVIQSYRDTHGQEHDLAIPNCIQALSAVKDLVLETILLQCPDPRDGAFVDPRPTLTEAWLQAMIALVDARSLDPAVESLMAETCVAIVSLIFYPTMGKTQNERMNDPGMTLDGPHSLAVTTFLGAFFRQVPTRILQAAGQRLLCIIPVDIASMQGLCQDQNFQGVAVVGAALFRACQGALPPWAVESIPDVYSSLFEAFGKDVEAFGLLMRLSMEVRLSKTSDLRSGFGGMVGGNLLSGRFFETMSDKAKETFIEETKQLCKENKATSWRRLKVSIKQNCGGKKRDTDFNQKPSQTRWEFDRI